MNAYKITLVSTMVLDSPNLQGGGNMYRHDGFVFSNRSSTVSVPPLLNIEIYSLRLGLEGFKRCVMTAAWQHCSLGISGCSYEASILSRNVFPDHKRSF
jgi:hypothetical protein